MLAPQRDARFVYLSVPSGYQPKTEKTIPLFHQQIEMIKDGYNFELMKNPQNDANHLFLVQADVQVTSEDDVKAYGRFLQDIKEYVQPYSGKRDIFGIDCETSWVIPLFCIHLTLIPYLLWTFPFIVLSATMT
ncbi:Predicted phosphohydrolases [Bacteroides thetaiotaomicron]|nr:Predicted phosphohydrolases [Bacteroides thetaiotaomicron]